VVRVSGRGPMPVKILAIAAEARIAGSLRELLCSRAQQCDAAVGVADGVKHLRAGRYDLILLDCGCAEADMDTLSRSIRPAGGENRLTPTACVDMALALEPGGDEAILDRICQGLISTCFDKSRILSLYRLLTERRYGNIFDQYAVGAARESSDLLERRH